MSIYIYLFIITYLFPVDHLLQKLKEKRGSGIGKKNLNNSYLLFRYFRYFIQARIN